MDGTKITGATPILRFGTFVSHPTSHRRLRPICPAEMLGIAHRVSRIVLPLRYR